jgi:hypothetical protein
MLDRMGDTGFALTAAKVCNRYVVIIKSQCIPVFFSGVPANDALFLIARTQVNSKIKLVSVEWDLATKTAKTSVISPVPKSYSSTSTFTDFDPVKSKLYWSTGPGQLFARDIGSSLVQNSSLVSLKGT